MGKFIGFMLLALVVISILQISAMASQEAGFMSDKRSGHGYGPGSVRSFQCPSQCSRRCSRTQYHKPCIFFCQKCCRKCLCVPPGFYGNKGVCPCYNNWKTQQGGPKCP